MASSGPRTMEGEVKISRNALRHGLCRRHCRAVVKGQVDLGHRCGRSVAQFFSAISRCRDQSRIPGECPNPAFGDLARQEYTRSTRI